MAWWKQRKDDDVLYVRYPHHGHGLEGKSSNSAKCSIKKDFLEFVDQNCQPNGRSADSGHATHYFLPKFQTIQTPKQGVRNYQERVKRSLVGEFNRAQSESGRGTASNYSASVWLRAERPKHAVYPHQKDYCDTCAKFKNEIQSKQRTLTRLGQLLRMNNWRLRKQLLTYSRNLKLTGSMHSSLISTTLRLPQTARSSGNRYEHFR